MLELVRGQIPQRLMRTFFIILAPEAFAQDTGFRDTGKERLGKEFVAKASVKALAKPVLPGTSFLAIGGLGLACCQPGFERVGDELRPVVAPEIGRCAVGSHQTRQDRDHLGRRQRGRYFNGETFAREVVAYRQHFELGCVCGRVEDEVQRPDMTRALCPQHGHRCPGLFALFALAARHLQAFLSPETLHPLDIDRLAFASQGVAGFTKAPTPATPGKSAQLLAQVGVFVGTRLVLESRTIKFQEPTGIALRDPVGL